MPNSHSIPEYGVRERRRDERSGSVVSNLVVLVLVVVALVGAVAGKSLVVALAGLVLTITVLARLWTRLALEEVTYACIPSPNQVVEGEMFELALTVENRKPLPVPWLRVSQLLPVGLEVIQDGMTAPTLFGGTRIEAITSLGGYQRVAMMRRVKATHRGHYEFGSARVEGSDLFGFYYSHRDMRSPRGGLVVYPRIVPLPDFSLPSARPIGDALSRRRIAEDLTRPAGAREYRSGDSIKAIDWKATARRGQLFTRNYDPSITQYVVIMLECDTDTKDGKGWGGRSWLLEAAVTGAASVAFKSIELGYSVGLIANGIPSGHRAQNMIPASRGPRQLSRVLEALARVQSSGIRPLEALTQDLGADAMPFGATIVFITGVFRPGIVKFVRELSRRGHSLVTLDIGGDNPPHIRELDIRNYRGAFTAPPPDDREVMSHA
jgi:uncharacterized protein (DUF58 family)